MKRTLVVLSIVVVVAAAVLLWKGRAQTNAAKTCRADARRFAEENASYEAKFDSLFGVTTLSRRSTSDLLDRDDLLMDCMTRDPGNREQYRALLYRNGFIQANRYFKYLLDTKQLQYFAQYERGQQAAQISNYHAD
jgi:type II secretory pathway pseudopilin PulG